jgi:hypothetical protein
VFIAYHYLLAEREVQISSLSYKTLQSKIDFIRDKHFPFSGDLHSISDAKFDFRYTYTALPIPGPGSGPINLKLIIKIPINDINSWIDDSARIRLEDMYKDKEDYQDSIGYINSFHAVSSTPEYYIHYAWEETVYRDEGIIYLYEHSFKK